VLQKIKSYIKFLWNSKNEHGVHSPFVFDLVTKCFYDKTKYPEYSLLKNNPKRARLLFRIIRYFKPKTILEIGNPTELNTNIFSSEIISFEEFQKNKLFNNDKTFDFIYFNQNESQKTTLAYFELLLPTITNNAVWIINDIHKSTENENTWDIIKKHPKVKVTIDTFHFGMVFFRAEQEKEDFVIRV
jgi:predicted O-methyltransferase YrrM